VWRAGVGNGMGLGVRVGLCVCVCVYACEQYKQELVCMACDDDLNAFSVGSE